MAQPFPEQAVEEQIIRLRDQRVPVLPFFIALDDSDRYVPQRIFRGVRYN